jgi:hypothetical protein
VTKKEGKIEVEKQRKKDEGRKSQSYEYEPLKYVKGSA